jgi:hypothetical protein
MYSILKVALSEFYVEAAASDPKKLKLYIQLITGVSPL